jgi:TIR domain
MNNDRINVFLCHATEDKAAVAVPLSQSLQSDVHVWLDQDAIKPGESIFYSVSAGLNECNYGVVILSPNFAAKSWAKSELAALWSFRMTQNKVLIPVWYNLDRQQVTELSPLIVDLKAIVSTNIETIASEIRFALGIGQEAKRAFSRLGNASEELRATLKMEDVYTKLAGSPKGAELFGQEWQNLLELSRQALRSSQLEDRFEILPNKAGFLHEFTVRGPVVRIDNNRRRILLRFELKNFASNSMRSLTLRRAVYVAPADEFEKFEAHIASDAHYQPRFTESEIPIWQDSNRTLLPTAMIVEEGFKLLFEFTRKAKNGERFKYWAG